MKLTWNELYDLLCTGSLAAYKEFMTRTATGTAAWLGEFAGMSRAAAEDAGLEFARAMHLKMKTSAPQIAALGLETWLKRERLRRFLPHLDHTGERLALSQSVLPGRAFLLAKAWNGLPAPQRDLLSACLNEDAAAALARAGSLHGLTDPGMSRELDKAVRSLLGILQRAHRSKAAHGTTAERGA